jgi:hypothetical protein
MEKLNRRSFFSTFAAAAAAVTPIAAATAAAVVGPKPIVGPLSPDQYIAEMEGLGISFRAVIVVNRDGKVVHGPEGYAEYWNDSYRHWDRTDEEIIRERQVRRAAGRGSSDTDVVQFDRRVAARLYEQGKVEYAGRYRPVNDVPKLKD